MRYFEYLTATLVACGPVADEGPASGEPSDVGDPVRAEVGAVSQATLDSYDFTAPHARFDLPGRLDEISGLAFTADGKLLGHDDERGRVYEIDPGTGQVGKHFDLGSGNVQDDFEGIAAIGARLFLVSSTGFLYEFREGDDEADVPYRVTDTGVGSSCEVEGLDFDPTSEALLLACKRADGDDRWLRLYSLPVAGGPATPIGVPRSELAAWGLDADFQPSALAVTRTGTRILLSAVTESIIEIDSTGRVLAGIALGKQDHPQPEGIAFGADGSLFIADERNGDDAHITVYRLQGDGA